ncbi:MULTISPECIES: hypothetical protein [unclassified Streptomyces]|uniref:hypothetical protein n=1 Tax=unclassified Streptomyces TaxID=2593676 RepID=UPI0035DED0EB
MAEVSGAYGRAYSLLLAELVAETARSRSLSRQARRTANSRVEGLRRGLVVILQAEHTMSEDEAASVVLAHTTAYREGVGNG